MIKTISLGNFRDAFNHAGRKEQFSYKGLESLFNYLEERDGSYDLDVIALCCTYSEGEYKSIASDYMVNIEGLDKDEAIKAVVDWLEGRTFVINSDDEDLILFASDF